MTKYREILWLQSQGISQRTIAISLSCSRNTVSKVLKRAEELNVPWPLKKPFTVVNFRSCSFRRLKCHRKESDLIVSISIKKWQKAG